MLDSAPPLHLYMTIDEVNQNKTLRDDIWANPEKYLLRHEEFHSVAGCPICQAIAARSANTRHNYRQGNDLCDVCGKEIDNPIHIPLI